jgi:hypothetical protein
MTIPHISANLSLSLACTIVCAIVPDTAFSAGTRIWELAGFRELENGELDGTVVSSKGEVGLGISARKLALEDIGLVWSAARGKKDDIYIGTGYDGKIFRLQGDDVRHIADTGQLIVTDIEVDGAGDLYVATLPDPIIWKIENPHQIQKGKPVKAEKWAAIESDGVKHVWTLSFGKDKKTLFAGTGPEAKVIAIGKDRKPEVYLDIEEEHVLTLVRDLKGDLIAGTSPSALLLRITGPGRALALADFDATEVKQIVPNRSALCVAVNTFTTPRSAPTKTSNTASTTGSSKSTAKKSKTVQGDGELYEIEKDGRREKLWEGKKEHVVCIAVTKDGTLLAGLGVDGKIISIDSERVFESVLDLEERQVMSLLAADTLDFVGTGDAGGAYSVGISRPAETIYLSPVLDTDVLSHWGRMTWLGRGKLKVQTRSGNTETPDNHWSDWSKPLSSGDEITSPPARYLQLSFSFADDPKALLISAKVAFKPQNLRAMILTFHPGSPFPKEKSSKSDSKISARYIDARPDLDNEAELSLSWTVSNPDDDDLRYQLWYRTVGETLWRPILRDDEVLKSTSFTWKTGSVPEGWYQIRLVADDSLVNDPKEVLSHEYISVPVLVDNNQPRVQKLTYKKGEVSGLAKDAFSFIAAVDVSVDGGPWFPASARDGVYDEREEAFSFLLPKVLSRGPHAVAARAIDRGGNTGIMEIHITR